MRFVQHTSCVFPGFMASQIAFQEVSQTILHQDNGQGETSQTKPISAARSALLIQVGLRRGWQDFIFFKRRKEMLFPLALVPANCQEKLSPLVHYSS